MPPDGRKPVVEHILPVASNLLAVCFAVVAFMAAGHGTQASLIDDCAGVAAVLFLSACILSYASMRSEGRSALYEKLADLIFLGGLGFLTLVTAFLVFGVLS